MSRPASGLSKCSKNLAEADREREIGGRDYLRVFSRS